MGFPSGSDGKNPPAMQETWVRSLGPEDPLEKGVAIYFSNYLENPMDREAWRATVYMVTNSQTQMSN